MKRCTHPRPLRDLVRRVQKCLTPDLLDKGYAPGKHPHAGHCAVATEAVWVEAARDLGYKSRVATWRGRPGTSPVGAPPCGAEDRKAGNCSSHWWLVSPEGCVLDPTSGQFSQRELEAIYARGRGAGAQGVRYRNGVLVPSARAAKVLRRMRGET